MVRLLRPQSICSLWIILFGLCGGTLSQPATATRVQAVRYWSFGDVTRVALQTQGDYKIATDQITKPSRIYFDLTGIRLPFYPRKGVQTITVNDPIVRQIRIAETSPVTTRIVLDVSGPVSIVYSQLVNPDRLMIELRQKRAETAPAVSLAHSSTGSQRLDLDAAPSGMLDAKEPVAVKPGQKTLSAEALRKEPPPASQIAAIVSSPAATTPKSVPLPSNVPDVHQAEPSGEQVAHAANTPPPVSAPSAGAASPSTSAIEVPGTPLKSSTDSTSNPASPVVASREVASPAPNASNNAGKVKPATRDSSGDRSLVRVLGLKLGRVVIDAGHGGHDTGTIGPNGLYEKDLVLDVALRLGKLITQQLGAEVIYTRSADVFIPLEERTRIANREKADLFISIHANSSPEPSATGVETYYFNLTSDKNGLDLATRENAASTSSISDLNSLLHKAVLENKLEESREFAQNVQSALWMASVKMNSRSRDRGVRHAPFVVLIGATMPSILAEIGFVSNPHDEKLLKRNEQRQKIADALFKGVAQYANGLSHTQLARSRPE